MDALDASAQTNVANTQAAVGFVLLKLGREEEALPYFKRQRALGEKLIAGDPLRIEYSYSLSEAIENIGMVSLAHASKAREP
jgi:hypothetical protein